jgi:hypothetical protein
VGGYALEMIAVAAQFNVCNVSARLKTIIVGSNPTRVMNVYVRLFRVLIVLCVGRELVTG